MPSDAMPLALSAVLLFVLILVARTAWKVLATLSFWAFFLGSLVPGLAMLGWASTHPGDTGVTFLAAGIHYLALGVVLGGAGGMFLPPSLIPPVRFPMGAILVLAVGVALGQSVAAYRIPGF